MLRSDLRAYRGSVGVTCVTRFRHSCSLILLGVMLFATWYGAHTGEALELRWRIGDTGGREAVSHRFLQASGGG